MQNLKITYSLEKHGFCFLPKVFTDKDSALCLESLWEIIKGKYQTGQKPENRFWEIGDDPNSIIKIDKPHLCNQTVWNFITNKTFGQFLGKTTQSKQVQVWHTQLVWKPRSKGFSGNAGWHRDAQYWPFWSEKGLYTAWIALSNVTNNSGPVRYVSKSHVWELVNGMDFFTRDLISQEETLLKTHKKYNVVEAILERGQVGVHSSLTYHSSKANKDNEPRVGLVVHFSTEKAERVKIKGENKNYLDSLQDPWVSPIIYEQE